MVPVPVTLIVVPCKTGGYAGAIEEYPVVAQAPTEDELHEELSAGFNAVLRIAVKQLTEQRTDK